MSKEVHLPGRFILPSMTWSEAHLDTLCFRCEVLDGSGKENVKLVPAVSSVPIYPEDLDCPVRIIGRLRSFHQKFVFQMNTIQRLTTTHTVQVPQKKLQLDTKNKGKTSTYMVGKCIRISPILRMEFGRVVFLELEVDSSAREVYVNVCGGSPFKKKRRGSPSDKGVVVPVFVALVGSALLLRPYLQLGLTYKFRNMRRSYWQKEGHNTDRVPDDTWFSLDSAGGGSTSGSAESDAQNEGMFCGLNVTCSDSDCIGPLDSHNYAARTLRYLRLDNPALREASLRSWWKEVHLVGTVVRVDSAGSWVLLMPSALNLSDELDGNHVDDMQEMCDEQNHFYLYMSHYSRPSSIQACLYPGSEIAASSVLPLVLWGRLVGFAVTMRSHLSVRSFGPCNLDDTSVVSQSSAAADPQAAAVVPQDQRRSCHVYSSWKISSEHSLRCCLWPQDSLNTQLSEVLATVLKLGTETMLNRDKRSTDSNSESPSDMLLLPLPEKHSIQAEFCDALYADLYSVRGGEDLDVMASLLYQPISVTTARKKCADAVLSSSAARMGSKFSTHWLQSDPNFPEVLVGSLCRACVIRQQKRFAPPRFSRSMSYKRNSDSTGYSDSQIIRNRWRWGVQKDETDDSGNDENIDANEGSHSDEDNFHNVPLSETEADYLVFLELHDASGATMGIIAKADPTLMTTLGSLLAAQPEGSEYGSIQVSQPTALVTLPCFLSEAEPSVVYKMGSRLVPCLAIATHGVRLVGIPNTLKTDGALNPHPPALEEELAGNIVAQILGIQTHPSNPILKAPTVGDNLKLKRRSACSVRQVLMDIGAISDSNITFGVVDGIVVSKELAVIDTGRFHSYGSKGAYGEKDRCALVLQDLRAADTIKTYVPLQQGRGVVAGMKIRLENCSLVVSAAGTAYLNCCVAAAKRSGTRALSVTGLVSLEHLPFYCHSKHVNAWPRGVLQRNVDSGSAQFSRGILALPRAIRTKPPTTFVSYLAETRLHNRCQWRIVGRASYIERVDVTLRCADCNKSVGRNSRNRSEHGGTLYSELLCPQCFRSHALIPDWTAVVCFDDGTGECLLHVESADDVFEFLQPNMALLDHRQSLEGHRNKVESDRREPAAKKESNPVYMGRAALQNAIEEYVRVHGHLKWLYQFRQQKRRAMQAAASKLAEVSMNSGQSWTEENTSGQDNLTAEEIFRASVATTTGANLAQEELMLDEFIEECDHSIPMEVECRLIHLRNSRGHGTKTVKKNIRIQSDNSAKPWNTYCTSRETSRVENLSVQVTAVRALGTQGVHLEAWHQLRSL